MSENPSYNLQNIRVSREPEQSRSLLAQGVVDDHGDGPTPAHQLPSLPDSSLPRTVLNGLPSASYTGNRVRFDDGERDSIEHMLTGHARTGSREGSNWPEAADEFSGNEFETRSSAGQRVPLLTGVEAPSVMLAEDLDLNAEGQLGNARPKSGIM